jgi:hypothetical protein
MWWVPAGDWVLLAYRIPREPSTPRIALWRGRRRLGAAQIVDGLVALPADSRTREQLEWLADDVIEAGGQAELWLGRPGSAAQERAIAARVKAAVGDEYRQVAEEARAALAMPSGQRKRTLGRLRRELRRIRPVIREPTPQAGVGAGVVNRCPGRLAGHSRGYCTEMEPICLVCTLTCKIAVFGAASAL